MNSQVWWFLARASGITAWALAAAAVIWGVALSGRALGTRPRAPWLLDLHRFLGGLAVVFTAIHMAALVADSYATFGLADLLVPFASSWKPLPVALGVVAFWLMAAVEITSLLMRRLPKKAWRAVHMTSYGLYVLATAHLLAAGTDAGNRALLVAAWGSLVVVAFLTAYRVLAPKRAARAAAAAARARVRTARPAATTEPVPETVSG